MEVVHVKKDIGEKYVIKFVVNYVKGGECTPSGECQECVDGYYKENTKCKICPTNCNTCLDAERCTSCKDGKYGSNKCDRNCSSHCEGRTCEINGKCNCDSKFYGETCDLECKGCSANGCEDKTGICVDHFCLDSFYDARMCNKTCSENCLDKNVIYLQENVYLVKIINGVNFVIKHVPQIVKMMEEQIVVL